MENKASLFLVWLGREPLITAQNRVWVWHRVRSKEEPRMQRVKKSRGQRMQRVKKRRGELDYGELFARWFEFFAFSVFLFFFLLKHGHALLFCVFSFSVFYPLMCPRFFSGFPFSFFKFYFGFIWIFLMVLGLCLEW